MDRMKVVILGPLSTNTSIGCIHNLIGGTSSCGWFKRNLVLVEHLVEIQPGKIP
jgi:hypothetical protein